MPVYKDKKGRYFIKTYVKDEFGNSKQITKRNKEWVGRKGKELALQKEVRLKKEYKTKKKKNKVEDLTMEDAIKKYLEEQKKYNKESTVYSKELNIRKHIEPFFNNKKMTNITIEDIEKWHQYLNEKKYKTSVKNLYNGILNGIFKTCKLINNPVSIVGWFHPTIEEKELEFNKEKKIKYITFEEFEKFISVVKEPKWNVFFNLLFFTGMRLGEVQALTWEDIDFKRKKIHVKKTYTNRTKECVWKITPTKNLKKRNIDIDNNLLLILKKYKKEKQKGEKFSTKDFVLETKTKEPLPSKTIDYRRKKYFELSGIKEITNHEFRHSHVSLMANEYLKSGETDVYKFFVIII